MTANPEPCIACGGSDVAPAFKPRVARSSDIVFSVVRCADCGLGWTVPPVPDEDIGRWYPPAYYGKGNVRFNALFERLVRVFRRRRARVIARKVPPGPVLDVGCGRGFLLTFLRELGFKPHGIELTEDGAWHARERLKIDVRVGALSDAPFPPDSLHAVIFWHSLEHVRRPEDALRRARKLLKPGGLLVVAAPNGDSLQARWLGRHWFHLDVPRHYYHFGLRSLERLLKSRGFKIVRVDHFSLEQNLYGWIQSLYNALGLEFNFLYEFLKSRTARTLPLRRHPPQALLTLLLLPVIVPASAALMLLETLLRLGGTIEVYAVRIERQ